MTSPAKGTALPSEIPTRRVEILTGELDLALRWDRGFLLLVVHNSQSARSAVEFAVEKYLAAAGRKVVRLPLAQADSIPSVQADQESERLVFFLDGCKRMDSAAPSGPLPLSRCDEIVAAGGASLVFWLTPRQARDLVRSHPEVWSARQCLVELDAYADSDEVLTVSLETEWRGLSEETYRTGAKPSDPQPAGFDAASKSARVLLSLGLLHWRKSEYEKSEQVIQHALDSATVLEGDAFKAECLNALALVKSSRGDFEHAIEAYKESIQLAPRKAVAWSNLGNLCMKAGRNDQAMIAYHKAIEQDAQDPIAWTGLGNVFYNASYTEEAIRAFRKAIELSPSLPHP